MGVIKNRINERLKQLHLRKEKALVCFLTAGFPTLDATIPLVLEIEKRGADIVELGMPFSDPLADGPVIQHSSQVALSQGITLDKILSCVKTIRQSSEIPLVLMGYLNPILAYGVEKFFKSAAISGVDGIILPELPLEESKRYKSIFDNAGLANILLVTPTTSPERMVLIDRASSGFLYCVSSTGVTGSKTKNLERFLCRFCEKECQKESILVGFGIRTPADARRIAAHADGVIIGSALIQRIARGESLSEAGAWVRQLKKAL